MKKKKTETQNPVFLRYLQHVGHNIECVGYGDAETTENVAIECVDCGVVLTDEFDEVETS
jgi:hypothetical protein